MNIIIEVKTFEPETTFENNSDEIKAYHIKASPHLTWIYKPSLQKTLFIFWTFKRQSPEIGSNKITCKITTIHQTFFSLCTCKETPNYKLENGELRLYQNFIYPFYIIFFNASQQIAQDVQYIKHSKRQFIFSKKHLFIHQQ